MTKETDEYLNLNSDDLNLYFSGTWLQFQANTDVGLHLVREFGGNRQVTVVYQLPSGRLEVSPFKHMRPVFDLPPVGYYNFKDTAVAVRRRTVRQNKKGICSQTFKVSAVTDVFPRYGAALNTDFLMNNTFSWTSREDVNAVFWERVTSSLPDAYRSIHKLRAAARALSPRFYMTVGLFSKSPTLFAGQLAIGEVVSERQINVLNSLLYQETCDFFRPQGVEVNDSSK